LTRNSTEKKIKKAGKILIISNQNLREQEVYELYKKRERIEKLFDSYKTALDADKLYLQDDESVFGHVFISFLSLYVYCKLEGVLKKAGLNRRISPHDLLLKYSKVYHLGFEENSIITEVPKKVIDLDMALGLNIFPR
jgi:Transposase DDE domain.